MSSNLLSNANSADMIVINAKIYTVALKIDEIKKGDYDFPVIENGGIAVRNEQIIAVGSTEEITEFADKHTAIIDAGGRVLIPGLIDSHIHAVWTGTGLLKADLSTASSVEDVLVLLKEKATSKKAGEWIEGIKWNELNWRESAMPTREDLDKVSKEHPIYCVRLCYHVAVANSKALELAGITRDTPDPEGGTYVRDENGEPTGLLLENAMFGVSSKIPAYGTEEYIQAIESIGNLLNQYGVTTVVDANLAPDQARAYSFAQRQNRLSYRARPMLFLDLAENDVDYQLRRLEELYTMTDFGDDLLKFNATKIMLDGIPAVGTAYFRRNYKHMPETNGFPSISQDDLNRLVLKSHECGWQVGIHALGDKAADMCIAAYRNAEEVCGKWDARHYIIHHPWPCDDQFDALRKYDIPITMQISIFHLMGEAKLYFDDMAQLNTPFGLYFKEGIVVGGSSDSPIGHPNPFLSMFAAVTRQDAGGVVFGPEHAITPKQALIAYTMYSAYISHDEALLGSIEAGKLADFVLLDRDFITGTAEEIKDTKPVLTVLGGKIVFDNR